MNSAPLPSTAELGFARGQGAAEMRRTALESAAAAGDKAARLAALLPEGGVAFCLALRHPAGFLAELSSAAGLSLSGLDPRLYRWSRVVARILDHPRLGPAVTACVMGNVEFRRLAARQGDPHAVDLSLSPQKAQGRPRRGGGASARGPATAQRGVGFAGHFTAEL